MTRVTVCVVLLCLFIPSCTEEPAPVEPDPSPTFFSGEDLQVKLNCLVVQQAAEDFAAANGAYPWAPRALVDFLPDSTWLENPFTGNLSEPIHYTAYQAGQTGYMAYWEWPDYVGYLITGYGKTEEIFRVVKNFPDSLLNLDSLVIANCYTVQEAVEAFAAENSGIYPSDVGVDQTPSGNTVKDFLPNGLWLRNPYTGVGTEPVDGVPAANPGETGYRPGVRTEAILYRAMA